MPDKAELFTISLAPDPVIDAYKKDVDRSTYEALLPHTERRLVFGRETLIVDLETLIRLKRAAGRPRDLDQIAELEAIADERNG